MIQRIQSLFILIYMIMISIFLFSDIIEITSCNNKFFLNAWCLTPDIQKSDLDKLFMHIEIYPYAFGGIMHIISLSLAVLAFFSYKNRKRQLNLLKLLTYFAAIEWLLIFYFILKLIYLSNDIEHIQIKLGVILLFLSPFLLFLAKFFIKKDELLVNSSNRFI